MDFQSEKNHHNNMYVFDPRVYRFWESLPHAIAS